MKMDERYSNATYGSAGLAAFFASLSLQDWGFIIGVAFSIVLGVFTYRLNKREQMKRTKILQDILTKTDASNPSATARVIADLSQKAPKEI
ncbi:phage holin family protein [Serratia marcescens]|uniref:phage holin family protein n=1 Tax=Serratia marcescens TaxID=615 RepID=UPI001F153B84|nr:phage holin family protein [Serratia marcescens]